MKIAIVVTDKKRGEVRIPLSKKEIGAMFDFDFMIDEDTWDCAELNEINKEVQRVFTKFQHLLHDIIYDGGMLRWCEEKDKWIPSEKWYMVKKPKWVQNEIFKSKR